MAKIIISETTLSLYDLSKEQLQDKKFLKSQIAKYTNKIKESKEKTARLKDTLDTYKGLLKEDPLYVRIYLNRKVKPVENPCRLCGKEAYAGDSICWDCEKKARRKDKGLYQITITCIGCGKTFYPKRSGIPFTAFDVFKCSCGNKCLPVEINLRSQVRVESKTYHYQDVTEIGKENG